MSHTAVLRPVATLVAVVTAAFTYLAYLPALDNGFVPWDDPDYITDNHHIDHLDAASLRWMATTFHTGNYHPLTWLSHAVDITLFGRDPRLHHRTNLLLHAADTLLCFAFTWQLIGIGRRRAPPDALLREPAARLAAATATALLFGLHPIHVESVAWVAERKDVLCGLFFLLTLLAYLRYTTRGGRTAYTVAVATTALALLAKPMAVSLPVVLLLLDLYPLERARRLGWRRLLLEKVPFALLAGGSAGVTVIAQAQMHAVVPVARLPIADRLLHAGHALCLYLGKLLWPACLSPLYELPPDFHPGGETIYLTAAIALTVAAAVAWRRGHRLTLTVWGYYVSTLLPVVGIVQVGLQAAADRYTYLPLLAPELAIGLGVGWLTGVARRRGGLSAAAAGGGLLCLLLTGALVPITRAQIHIWHDGESLWRHAITCGGDAAPQAWTNLGVVYDDAGRLEEAVRCYRKAVTIRPTSAEAISRLGTAYARSGNLATARAAFTEAIRLSPGYAVARTNLARLDLKEGRLAEAIAGLQEATRLTPTYARAHSLLGAAYLMAGDPVRAISELRAAITHDPTSATAYRNLTRALMLTGDTAGAAAVSRMARPLGGTP